MSTQSFLERQFLLILKYSLGQCKRKKSRIMFKCPNAHAHSQCIKGAVCRTELGIAVQIQNIEEGFFHPAPPPHT